MYANVRPTVNALLHCASHCIEFKRQVAREVLADETLHVLAKRHGILRNLIRLRVQRCETGAFDDDATAADMIQAYEPRVAALERWSASRPWSSSF